MLSSSSRLPQFCVAALLFLATNSCVTPDQPGSSGGGGGAANGVFIRVDGRDIKVDEAAMSIMFRQSIKQFAYVEHVKREAAAAGIKPDAAEIQKRIEEAKTQANTFNMGWDEYLAQQGLTEDEFRDMLEFQSLAKLLSEKEAGDISEEELKKEFDATSTQWLDQYATENSLTEGQKKELKYETIKDWLKTQLVQKKIMEGQSKAYVDALKAIKLEIPALKGNPKHDEIVKKIIRSGMPAEAFEEEDKEAGTGESGAGEAAPAEGEPAADASEAEAPPADGDKPEAEPGTN